MAEPLIVKKKVPLRPVLATAHPLGTVSSQMELSSLCVPQWIARTALAAPAAIAVTQSAENLTYAELESRSNQLANFLRAQGVNAGQVVGLYLGRSPAMVIAALAVLKVGAAYLPLPPDSPKERIEFMLRDAQTSMVITESASAARLGSGDYRMVALDRDAAEIARQSTTPLATAVGANDLAYVIYTSGSTGQPKGVEVLHRGLSNLVTWHLRAFQITPADRASHLAALGFDAAVWELWPYLAAGASVHLASDAIRQDPEALRNWLVSERISVAFLPTPLGERMLLLEWPKHATLRVLLTGADTLRHRPSPNLPFALVNNYGPTECTVVATSGIVSPAGSSNQVPSIGRAIDNTQTYILDEGLNSVPAGTPGELYLGGAGVARGYRNHPELTKQMFVANPFSSDPAGRMYRTGDRVRCLANGEIEFLGRFDEQVKIRGYRVEPNEIEKALDAYPDVQNSAVVAREEGAEKRLIAYLVLSPNSKLTAAALREYVSKHFPPYMVPSSFVRVSALPITANGKVDRSALPDPSSTNSLADEAFMAPDTLVEQRLAGILSPLLNVKEVGLNDNFFLLGGHSLLGTQLLTRISQVFGVDLSLFSLFDHPTVAGMSVEIEKLILAKLESLPHPEVPVHQGGSR
jgi:amino acid adenylation domain-containing protein